MFLRVQTQWRTGPNGYIGLDYGVVMQFCNLYKVSDMKSLIEDLQVMEMYALERIAKSQKEEQRRAEAKSKRFK